MAKKAKSLNYLAGSVHIYVGTNGAVHETLNLPMYMCYTIRCRATPF